MKVSSKKIEVNILVNFPPWRPQKYLNRKRPPRQHQRSTFRPLLSDLCVSKGALKMSKTQLYGLFGSSLKLLIGNFLVISRSSLRRLKGDFVKGDFKRRL